AVTRCGLVVPAVFAGIGIQRDDGGDEQVVAAAGRTDVGRPGRAVAGSYIDEVGDRVVGDGIPGRATATGLPPFTIPGLGGPLEFGLFEAQRGITRDCPPAPQLVAVVGV